jgi:hypothetical protein
MYLLLFIFLILNFVNFFLLFQSETFILFFSFFFIISSFYAFANINLKNIYLENLKWIETVRFYIIISNWHKCYIRLNELKVVKFYNLVQALKTNLFIKLNNIEKHLTHSHHNNLKKAQLLRLAHLEKKLKLYKDIVRLNRKNLKYKLLVGNL